jgi:L-lactate dehydrogenase complex protein LldG
MVGAEKAGIAMSPELNSRAAILKSLGAGRAAVAEGAFGESQEGSYIRRGSLSARARVEKMIERLREYDAEVNGCDEDGLAAAIAAQLARSGRRKFVAPSGLPKEWLAEGFDWKIDGGLSTEEIEGCDGVLTACYCAVAESGTIVLHHSAAEGRRVITLLPDWHLCILRTNQIVETLPEYFDRCKNRERWNEGTREREDTAQEADNPPALVTWISGPSATADIEMTRIKGVHGPRFLNVIVVNDRE